MAYFVAKQVGVRPMEVLVNWTCEELLVAYGMYANSESKQGYDMLNPKERAQKKLTWLDRWAMPFFKEEDMTVSAEDSAQIEEMNKIAQTIFG